MLPNAPRQPCVGFRKFRSHLIETVLLESADSHPLVGSACSLSRSRGNLLELLGACRDPWRACGNGSELVGIQGRSVGIAQGLSLSMGIARWEHRGSLAVGFHKFRSHLIETMRSESADIPLREALGACRVPGEVCWNCHELVENQG